MARRQTLHEFEQFRAKRETRGMDEICTAGEGAAQGFQLQAHQEFLRQWVAAKEKQMRALLLYHQIGSGKTCTSIAMALQWLKAHPRGRVRVVLPARLRTNYWDELLSPCTMNEYFTREQYEAYANAPSAGARKRLRAELVRAVSRHFDVMSFDALRREAAAAQDLGAWAREFTRNTFLVVDEVHNLLTTGYKEERYAEMAARSRLPRGVKCINTMLMRYMVAQAHATSKMVFLSATPVFDNPGQFLELVRILDPSFAPPPQARVRLSDAVERLRGKVSFFPGVSPSAYPRVQYIKHDVRASREQVHVIQALEEDEAGQGSGDEDAFMLRQRMAAVAVMPRPGNPLRASPAKLAAAVQNLRVYAPKVEVLLRLLADEPGKHIVYCGFVDMGIDVVHAALRARGWVNLEDVVAGRAQARDYLTYCVWDGKTKDALKNVIKATANAADNMDGRRLRVVVGSPSIKEGISFKHVQHLHMLDPVWNQSTKTQIEGRAIRFCSHAQVPARHATLKRAVLVHTYRLVAEELETSDQYIYDVLIPTKHQMVEAAEAALKRVSFDYLLFKRLHESGSPASLQAAASPAHGESPIHLDKDFVLRRAKDKDRQPGATCPRPRRPVAGACGADQELRTNKHGDPCCYKVRKAAAADGPKPQPKPKKEKGAAAAAKPAEKKAAAAKPAEKKAAAEKKA